MTGIELAINWIRSQGWSEENLPCDEFEQMLQAFLAGLKAGRPKWHKVANGDLPDNTDSVLSDKGVIVYYNFTHACWVKEYIRFGEIPKDEKSKIGNGIIGDGYEVVGCEKGVSVWDCVYNFDTSLYQLVAPHPTRFTSGDFSQASDPENCCGCDPNKKIYVVTGIEVGYGADNEPLLKDVKIVKELPFDYFKQKVISDRKIKE